MRIHLLRFRAIGPFEGEHEIDFDALSASGLFMLEGPTGSGKSTIIDAIVYALYGQVAAEGSVATRMRSDHAAPAVSSYVELTFSTERGLYRVRRTPSYDRPKKTGTGTTQEKASASLVRLTGPDDPAGEGVATRVDEVSAEIQRLVGLTRQQFTQVVVLPQGQFAQFLKASTADRAAVLQKVFGTQVYESVQRILRETAERARKDRAAAEAELAGRVHRFVEAAACERQDEEALLGSLAAGPDEDALRSAMGARQARVGAEATAATAAAAQAQAAHAEAASRLAAEEQLDALVRRREALLRDAQALDAAEPEVAECAARVDAAQRARVVADLVTEGDRAATAHRAVWGALPAVVEGIAAGPDADLAALLPAETLRHAEDVMQAEPEGPGRPGDGGEGSGPGVEDALLALRTAHATTTEERATLVELEESEVACARDAAALARDEAALPALERRIETTRADGVAREAEVEQRREQRSAAAERAAGLEEAVLAHREAKDLAARAEQLAAARAEESAGRERLRERLAAEESADAEARRVRAAWVAGQAARLADALVPEEPCPVCGSPVHPAPAAGDGEVVADARLETAQSAASAARVAVARARVALDAAEARVAELAPGAPEPAEAAQAVARAAEREEAARAAVAERSQLERDIESGREAAERAHRLAEESVLELARLRAALTERAAGLEARQARLLEARGPFNSVAGRRAALAERAQRAATLVAALERVRDAKERLDEAARRLAAGLVAEGFPDAAAARSATLPPAELAGLQGRVTHHGNERHRVLQGLAEERVAALSGEETPDVTARREAADLAVAADREAAARRHEAHSRVAEAAAAASAVQQSLERIRDLDAASGPLVRMATVAAGEGANRVRLALATFVLVRRFEEVLAAANTRLSAMTGGRYEMVRSTEREKGQRERRTGLGIEVVDHHTDRPRSPASLSGGETFQFSLCLALGLADVVSEENGSIEMGTLFVDEGFGTLDAATLDIVMQELTALHEEGHRAVGVVSHVTEMKSQIAERVEVRRTERGSTLTVRA